MFIYQGFSTTAFNSHLRMLNQKKCKVVFWLFTFLCLWYLIHWKLLGYHLKTYWTTKFTECLHLYIAIVFLPRSKSLLISWLQSQSTVILEAKKRKSTTISTFSPSICHEVMGLDALILVFWVLSFKPAFSLTLFTPIKKFFSSSSLLAVRVTSLDSVLKSKDITLPTEAHIVKAMVFQ